MDQIVCFRGFEDRDVDFVYRCKNDAKLNSMTVGRYHPFTYKEAQDWVKGCMGNNESFEFWAICTNDEEQRIVGWVSLSEIDRINSSACFHGIVIGDDEYRDGMAWIQSFLFIYRKVFEDLKLNRLYGSCLEDQKASFFLGIAMCETQEGVARNAVYKNGKYNNVIYMSILKEEYYYHKNRGDFEFYSILQRLAKVRKQRIASE